ncbi:MAG TPA: hypothetical protein VFK78_00925 [Gemmatimonadales bacterium]|nr:hypothetical protein [Gemmatimonadales bacterium]
MEPGVFLTAIAIFLGIPAVTIITLARLRSRRGAPLPGDVPERLEELERGVQDLRQQLEETQERLDFTERLLSRARDARRIEGERAE